jgi:hypothetical protein
VRRQKDFSYSAIGIEASGRGEPDEPARFDIVRDVEEIAGRPAVIRKHLTEVAE